MRGPRRVRLQAREIHRAAALAHRQQEGIAERGQRGSHALLVIRIKLLWILAQILDPFSHFSTPAQLPAQAAQLRRDVVPSPRPNLWRLRHSCGQIWAGNT